MRLRPSSQQISLPRMRNTHLVENREAMKRWIIRSFFIGLLLLCMIGWAWSYKYSLSVSYNGPGYSRSVGFNRGRVGLEWIEGFGPYLSAPPAPPIQKGWHIDALRVSAVEYSSCRTNLLGFRLISDEYQSSIIIP